MEWAKTVERFRLESLRRGLTIQDLKDPGFFDGFIVAPSTTIAVVEEIEKLVVVDGAHGVEKTLLSLHGFSANANMIPLAIGFFADNECLKSWEEFFEFVLEVYPGLDQNQTETSFINDQDKGLQTLFLNTFSFAMPFRCAHHRMANVQKTCRSNPELAASLYMSLVKAPTMEKFNAVKHRPDESDLLEHEKDYILGIDDAFIEQMVVDVFPERDAKTVDDMSDERMTSSPNTLAKPVSSWHFACFRKIFCRRRARARTDRLR